MTYYKQTYNLNPMHYPNAERIWKGTVSLPIYSDMKEEGLEFICQTIKSLLNNRLNYFFYPEETSKVHMYHNFLLDNTPKQLNNH